MATQAQIDSGVLSGESKPASCSISHIFPSMPEERLRDKVTNVPLFAFPFQQLEARTREGSEYLGRNLFYDKLDADSCC